MISCDDREPRLNILISFTYFTAQMARALVAVKDHVRLVIDSGAFTAWKAGKVVNLDDYCRFLENLPVRPWRYFTLDAIGDPELTEHNYRRMLDRGLTPVPIFTRGENPAALDTYYQSTDLVGVGGLVGTRNNKAFVNGIMRHIAGRRVHWLGFTNLGYLKTYRPYMCDSSAWTFAGRVGGVTLYMGHGRFITFDRRVFTLRRNELACDRIRSFNLEPTELLRRESWHGSRSMSRRINSASFVELSLDIQKHLGTLMFLATATDYEVGLLIDAYNQRQKGLAA